MVQYKLSINFEKDLITTFIDIIESAYYWTFFFYSSYVYNFELALFFRANLLYKKRNNN